MARVWAGVDAGKTHHHCVVIDADGKKLLSRRVANDEPEPLTLIGHAATGGDMAAFGTPDRLAGFAGLAPAPRDSGRIRGNLRRPERYHRGLNRVFYHSAMVSITCSDESRAFYDRKRAEGKKHTQAVLALARKRVNVLWALIRDKRTYQARPPKHASAQPAA